MKPKFYPNTKLAEQLYPKVLARLQNFEQFVDNQQELSEEEFELAYQKMADDLQALTQKDMADYMLWEWWEADGIEVLAFEIALPNPPIYAINKDELKHIVTMIKNCQYLSETEFEREFTDYFGQYFHQLLAINFPKSYDYGYFHNHQIHHQDISFDIDDIVECIWSNKPYQSHKKQLLQKYCN